MKKKEYISPEFEVIYLKAKHRLLVDSKKYQSTKNLRSTDDEGMENGLEFD